MESDDLYSATPRNMPLPSKEDVPDDTTMLNDVD